jgi:ubiquinone/menaquinone biosynthesis C-methylase UbiE
MNMKGNTMNQFKSIEKAYKKSKNIYDDILTQSNWLTSLYIRIFWNLDDNEITEKVLDFIPKNFSGKLLDVPVGTGVFTCKKYKSLSGADIRCLDFSRDMLLQAEQRFKTAGIKNIACIRGDVGDLPFKDETFDIVLSMNGFHAFPEKQKAFHETSRVLKKGGLFTGCFYIKKQKFLTDFIVNIFLSKMGWFTPPFHTKTELIEILKKMYSDVDVYNDKAIAWFRCRK